MIWQSGFDCLINILFDILIRWVDYTSQIGIGFNLIPIDVISKTSGWLALR